jgi:hypothetical protein
MWSNAAVPDESPASEPSWRALPPPRFCAQGHVFRAGHTARGVPEFLSSHVD